MTTWAAWRRACVTHALTRVHAKRIERSLEIVRTAHRQGGGRLFISLSGGKDSVALAAIVAEATGERVPAAHASTALTLPDSKETAWATVEHLDLPLEVRVPAGLGVHLQRIRDRYGTPDPRPDASVEPTEFDLLRAIPASVDVTDPEPMAFLWSALAGGNMMVAWTYEGGFEGSYIGLRADESSGRARLRSIIGPIHRHSTDGKLSAYPMLDWKLEDVYGFIFARGLPLHPFYQRAFIPGLKISDLRVAEGITSGGIAAHGALAHIKRTYPSFWMTLASIRPELNRYVL